MRTTVASDKSGSDNGSTTANSSPLRRPIISVRQGAKALSDLDKERVANVVAETGIDIVEPADVAFGEQGVTAAPDAAASARGDHGSDFGSRHR